MVTFHHRGLTQVTGIRIVCLCVQLLEFCLVYCLQIHILYITAQVLYLDTYFIQITIGNNKEM